jgi:membrane peptidoglycan carboxypeptidase
VPGKAVPHRRAAWQHVALLVLAAVAALALLLVALRLLPHAALREHASYSRAFYSSDGALLRLTLARDEQYRVWTPLARIDPRLVQAVLLYEDRWFDCTWASTRPACCVAPGPPGGVTMRRGGSTITMQLARRLYRIDSRTPAGKLQAGGGRDVAGSAPRQARDPGGLPQPGALRRQHRRRGCGQPGVLWQTRPGPAAA